MKRFCVGKVGNWGVIEWEDGIYPQMGDKLYSQPADITNEEILHEQQAEIEALKRPNNVVGVPCDELKKMQDRLAHPKKMVVWYQDITMTGINSEEYENGFWDAVGFVKQHQIGVQEK